MSEPTPGLNHGAVLDGFYLRLRERNHEELREAEGLFLKGHALWRDLQRTQSALAEAHKEIANKQEALVAAWAEIKRLRQYEPHEYSLAE